MKPNNSIRTYVKCRGCGKRILRRRSKFCPDCFKLDHRLHSEDVPVKGRNSFWAYVRKHGRRCCYSGVSLETDDETSPWYLVFARLVPGDESKIVPAAALFAVMKSALSKKEFRYYVLALDDHRRKHLKIKKIPVVHWRLLTSSMLTADGVCPVCGQPIELKGHKYCARCSRLVFRMKLARFPRQAINAVLDYLHKYGFVCYYTGMSLDTDDPKSPSYLVFDHWKPRDPRKMVVTSALVNAMKGDLTEEEFWYFIRQLAKFYREGSPVRKIKLACWCRSYRSRERTRSL
jgi:hypothetical protein